MRLVLTFEPVEGVLPLPIHYNHLVQGMIYRSLDRALRNWLHQEGFVFHKRHFKLFTFSRLMAKRRTLNRETRSIVFEGPVRFKVGSVEPKILESLAIYLVKNREVRLNGTRCQFQAVEVEMPVHVEGPVIVKTLSPITVYRTLYTADGRKKTYYFNPWEDEFEELVLDNLRRKAKAYAERTGEKIPPLEGGSIKSFKVRKEVIIKFKGTVIKGWDGLFEVHLPDPYFQLAYHAGLGAKNSQGFGMVEVVKKEVRESV